MNGIETSRPRRSAPARRKPGRATDASDWRGTRLDQLRGLILSADPKALEEVKWRKPSRPEGVPVWSHNGILCIGEELKNAVRLTFPKGASLPDPQKIFNCRLESKTVRAIDFGATSAVDEPALRALVRAAVARNASKDGRPRPGRP